MGFRGDKPIPTDLYQWHKEVYGTARFIREMRRYETLYGPNSWHGQLLFSEKRLDALLEHPPDLPLKKHWKKFKELVAHGAFG